MTSEQYVKLLKSTLRRGSIIDFKGDFPFASKDKHHFVILNYDSATSEYIVAVNNTSKVTDRLMFLHQTGADVISTTVVFAAGQYSFFPRQTLFDCNTLHAMTVAELAQAHANGHLSIPDMDVSLTNEDIEKLCQAALKSRNIAPIFKKLIDPNHEQ